MNQALTDNATATLLLCGRSKGDASLTPSEFNQLTLWLQQRGLQAGQLFNSETMDDYAESPINGISQARLCGLLERGGEMALRCEPWLNSGFWILCRDDEAYPRHALRVLGKDAPALLYGVGGLDLLNEPGIAILGSRNVSLQGQEFAFALGESCARQGITVISGGARGVDSHGGRGALEAGGGVVGVLAGDLARSAAEARDPVESGKLALMSLYPPDTPFSVGAAMGRNRMLYGMSRAAVIVASEARTGGTWAGAEENHRRRWTPMFIRDAAEESGNLAMLRLGWGRPFPASALESPMSLLQLEEHTDDAQGELFG